MRSFSIRLALSALSCLCAPRALVAQQSQVHTDRPAGRRLIQLPRGEDAFAFVVYGDRTGGVPAGLKVLDQAVTDTNLLDPDFVMTVGDLVQGYNATPEYLEQVREFKSYMAKLDMPWFPVAGNHDIYFRGEDRPLRHHEDSYEQHFGPLWYAFEHKDCWFVVLFSDEGNPQTGQKAFNVPELQRMSPEQFAWLEQTLDQAKEARHVFVFLHHPRWLEGRYGTDWRKVHKALADAGNVRAVFAGHIHRMQYAGMKDGIEYFALATTGGNLPREVPSAGFLHHFNVVTVREDKISMATVPVGAVLDPRKITVAISNDVDQLDRSLQPIALRSLQIDTDGVVDDLLKVGFDNPTSRPIELTLTPGVGAAADRWAFSPDHTHMVVAPGERGEATFSASWAGRTLEDFRPPRLQIDCDYLAPGARISLPPRVEELDCNPPADLARAEEGLTGHLHLEDGALRLSHDELVLPDGPFTIETWFRGDDYRGRRGLACKTESSEYGLFVSDGRPNFSLHLNGRYVVAQSDQPALESGRWHHLAGVFDGREVRLYLDGERIAQVAGSGRRSTNDLPLLLGADVDRRGLPTSHFAGDLDEFRLSTGARYTGARFTPRRRFEADGETVVLLHMDRRIGPWVADHSMPPVHATTRGGVRTVPGSR